MDAIKARSELFVIVITLFQFILAHNCVGGRFSLVVITLVLNGTEFSQAGFFPLFLSLWFGGTNPSFPRAAQRERPSAGHGSGSRPLHVAIPARTWGRGPSATLSALRPTGSLPTPSPSPGCPRWDRLLPGQGAGTCAACGAGTGSFTAARPHPPPRRVPVLCPIPLSRHCCGRAAVLPRRCGSRARLCSIPPPAKHKSSPGSW